MDLKLPPDSYGFYFFDRIFLTLKVGEVDIELTSKKINRSKDFYPIWRLVSMEELLELDVTCPHSPTFEEMVKSGIHSYIKIGYFGVYKRRPEGKLYACDIQGVWNEGSEFVSIPMSDHERI